MTSVLLLCLAWLGCRQATHPLEAAAEVLARPDMTPEAAAQELMALGFDDVEMKRSKDGKVPLVQLDLEQPVTMAELEAMFGAPTRLRRRKGGQQYMFTPKTAKEAVDVTYIVKPVGDAPIEEVWAGRNIPLD